MNTYQVLFAPIQALWDLTDEISIQLFSLGEDFEKLTYGIKFSESIRKNIKMKDSSGLSDRVIRIKMANDVKRCWQKLSGFLNVWGKVLDVPELDEKFRKDLYWPEFIQKISISKSKPFNLNQEDIRAIMEFYDAVWNLAFVLGGAFRHPEFAQVVSAEYGDKYEDRIINKFNKVTILDGFMYDMYPNVTKHFIEVFDGINIFVREMEEATGIKVLDDTSNRYSKTFGNVDGVQLVIS